MLGVILLLAAISQRVTTVGVVKECGQTRVHLSCLAVTL